MLPNNAAVKHFYTNRERCEVLTGYLSLSAGPTVTGPIRDIGQNVLQPSVQTGSYSSHSYFRNLFPTPFLEETFMRNIVIILCTN